MARRFLGRHVRGRARGDAQRPGTDLVLAGVALATLALVNHAVARFNERRHPPTGSFVEVDGVRLHYIERGSGPPVVLLHGNGAVADDFVISGVFDLLAQNHRVIAIDRPGFGHSGRPGWRYWNASAQAMLIHDALRRIGVRRPVLVGHSWGTLVALSMALDNRLDTGGVVLMSGYYTPTVRGDVPVMALPAVPLLGDLLRYTIWPAVGWLTAGGTYRMLFSPLPVTAAFKACFPLGLSLRPSQLKAAAADATTMVPDAAALASRHHTLGVPTVILAGTGDRIVDFERQSQRLARRIGHATLMPINGAGHMVHHVAPERVVEAVRRVAKASAPVNL